MARIQLIGGSYEARSVIANAQKCINYFPEMNRRDAPVPMTYYQRGGRRPLVSGPRSPVRGLYKASNGNGYCVIGQNVYSISPGWGLTLLGALTTVRQNPVSFSDNGTTIVLVDGSALGYTINMTTNAFAVIVDPTGAFTGATRVDTLDTYMLWNYPGTRDFGSTLSNTITFNALYIAGKVTYPDPLMLPIVNRRQLILLGALKSEIWYNAGNAQFPFAELPGSYVEHGCVAPYSAASADIEVFWLSQDLQGQGMVMALKGYDTRRISNFALEVAIRKMGNVSDAIGWTYLQDGHVFYTLVFPSGNQTWVYDSSLADDPTLAWHQECYMGNTGLERMRDNCGANINGLNVVGDYANGTLYAVDPEVYTDTVDAVVRPIRCVKSFPHITQAWSQQIGQPSDADGKVMQWKNFALDMDCGLAVDADAQVELRVSRDKGHTFEAAEMQSAGGPGAYLTQPQWQPLGLARDMVFEIAHQINGPAALNGAWIDAVVTNT